MDGRIKSSHDVVGERQHLSPSCPDSIRASTGAAAPPYPPASWV